VKIELDNQRARASAAAALATSLATATKLRHLLTQQYIRETTPSYAQYFLLFLYRRNMCVWYWQFIN